MGNIWPVQEARARFSEMLEASHAEGPQIVTKRTLELLPQFIVDAEALAGAIEGGRDA